jgi:4-amino-4-deoxy-L-arabinose transferase-like glycosyltransferase
MPEGRLTDLLTRHRFGALLLLGLLLYVPFLGLRDMWYPDEPDIGEVCKAMYTSGDWIAPRRMGEIWVDYPPMIYWTGTATSHLLGGFSEFALRLPNSLAAIALALITAWAASRWRGPWTGFWAGFALLTFLQFAYEAVNYRPDVLFSLFIGAGMVVYAKGAGERPSWLLRVAGFALLGLAMLSKGPLGLLLPGLVLTLWHGSRREWRRVLELAPLALVSMAVYMPWFVACARAMGADSILSELYAQSFARFVGATHRGHGQPFYYYFTQIWIDLLWWGPLLPFAIWWGVRSGLAKDRNYQLWLWWFGVFLVFLSTAVTKRQVYMLPAYPAAALLLAPWLARLIHGEGEASEPAPAGKPVRVYGYVLSVVFLVLAIVMLTITFAADLIITQGELEGLEVEVVRAERVPAAIMALVLLCAAGWIFQAARRASVRRVLVRLAICAIPFFTVVFGGIMPALNVSKTYRPQCDWIRSQIGEEESFGLAYPPRGHHKMGGFSLYTGVHVELLNDREALERYLAEHPGSLVLVHGRHIDDYFSPEDDRWRDGVVRELLVGRDRYLVLKRLPTS